MPALELLVLADEFLASHPVAELHVLELLAQVTAHLGLGVPGVLFMLVHEVVVRPDILIREADEVLDDLLLEVKLGVQLLQGGKGLLKIAQGVLRGLVTGDFVAIDVGDGIGLLLHLLAETRSVFM